MGSIAAGTVDPVFYVIGRNMAGETGTVTDFGRSQPAGQRPDRLARGKS